MFSIKLTYLAFPCNTAWPQIFHPSAEFFSCSKYANVYRGNVKILMKSNNKSYCIVELSLHFDVGNTTCMYNCHQPNCQPEYLSKYSVTWWYYMPQISILKHAAIAKLLSTLAIKPSLNFLVPTKRKVTKWRVMILDSYAHFSEWPCPES
jgi:hypothetical protein